MYNADYEVFQGCTASGWVPFHEPGAPGGGGGGPTGCANIGIQCDDNSYYIGDISGNKIYAASADESGTIRWDNSGCFQCGDGTVATSTTDGEANVADMKAYNIVTLDGFDAARQCDQSTAHGHNDWYLPSKDELNLFWKGGSPLVGTGIDTSGSYYWSSTEDTTWDAWRQRFSDGYQAINNKDDPMLVRCVRR